MTTIANETEKYARVWKHPSYRRKCHSLDLWNTRRDLFPKEFESAIDIGCGLGRLIGVWRSSGIDAEGVDLVPDVCLEDPALRPYVHQSTLWDFHPGKVYDVGICADVMEHLPEQHIHDALRAMSGYCRRVIFKIANYPSHKLGDELHLTQRDAVWWRSVLWESMCGGVSQVDYETPLKTYVYVWRAS